MDKPRYTQHPPVFGASEMVDREGPWAGYPRAQLFAEARFIAAVTGVSFTRALCKVVMDYEKARRLAEEEVQK